MSITKRGVILAATVSAAVALAAGALTAGAGHAGSRLAAPERDHRISTSVDSTMLNNTGRGHCVQHFRHTVTGGEETSQQDGRCEWRDVPEPAARRSEAGRTGPETPSPGARQGHRQGEGSCDCTEGDSAGR